jgi:flagellar motor switch/type III secretory pathway protein FliN
VKTPGGLWQQARQESVFSATRRENAMSTALQTVEPPDDASTAPLSEAPPGPSNAGEQGSARSLFPWLPCTLALDVPVTHFTVRDLLQIRAGSIVETDCHQSSDIPMRVNGLLMAWTEFELIGERLAARITDLA